MLKQISGEIGPLLKSLRGERGLTQSELGSRVGMSQSHIHKIEAGSSDVRLSTLVALLQSLGYELAVGDPLTIRAARVLEEPQGRARFE